MRFLDTDKPYVNEADHLRPLYHPDADIGIEPKHVEFTGFKSIRCKKEFHEAGVSFISGRNWMYKLKPELQEDKIFMALLGLINDNQFSLGLDPRAREKGGWYICDVDVMLRILELCHIYGVTDRIYISGIVSGVEDNG